jgi:hydrogenase maturation factor
MRVLRVDAERSLAMCLATDREIAAGEYGAGKTAAGEDGEEEVAIDLVALVAAGDTLIVHAGVALANLGPAPLAPTEGARERAWSRLTIASGGGP